MTNAPMTQYERYTHSISPWCDGTICGGCVSAMKREAAPTLAPEIAVGSQVQRKNKRDKQTVGTVKSRNKDYASVMWPGRWLGSREGTTSRIKIASLKLAA